jgi:hypothetical protein
LSLHLLGDALQVLVSPLAVEKTLRVSRAHSKRMVSRNVKQAAMEK